MKRSPILLFIALFFTSTTVYGQLEMSNLGHVGIGTVPSPLLVLNVDADGMATALNVISNDGPSGVARYGTQTKATGSDIAIGIRAEGENASNINYGVLATTSGSATSYAGYFVGDVVATGSCCAAPSDDKLKTGVTSLVGSDIMSRLMQLRPISYLYRTDEYEMMNLSDGRKYGLSAQATEKVFPEFVRTHLHPPELDAEGRQISDPISYKGINYSELIPLLLSAIQEQQKRIEALEAALNN